MAHNEIPQTPENRHGNVSEFYDDVYIYGKLYADIDATAIDWGGGGDINSTPGVEFLTFPIYSSTLCPGS